MMKAPMIEIPEFPLLGPWKCDECDLINNGCPLDNCPGPGKFLLIPAAKARVEAVAKVLYCADREETQPWEEADHRCRRIYRGLARDVLASLGVDAT